MNYETVRGLLSLRKGGEGAVFYFQICELDWVENWVTQFFFPISYY